MGAEILSAAFVAAFLAAPMTASAQAGEASPAPSPAATATPEELPTPEPMPTPEPIPEEGPMAGKPTSAVLHGFVLVRYDLSDGKGLARDAQNAYAVQNARLRATGDAAPGVRYALALEPLLTTGPLQEAWIAWSPAKTLGPLGNLRLTAGQFRRPLGYEGRVPEETWIVMDKSMTTSFLDVTGSYDIGVAAGATIAKLVELEVGVFNGTGPINAVFLATSLVGGVDDLDHKDVAGRAGVALMDGKLRAGLSGAAGHASDAFYFGSTGADTFYYWRAGLDAEAAFGPAVVIAEAAYGNSTPKVIPLVPGDPAPGGPTATGAAAYLLAGWRLRAFLPFFRFGYVDPTIGDGDDVLKVKKDWANAVTAGVNWDPVKRVRVRAQYQLVSGLASQPSLPTYYDPAAYRVYSGSLSGTASISVQADF